MARYGNDYGRWGGDRYDQGFGERDRGMGHGGMRSGGWNEWRSLPGEAAWFGEGQGGYPTGGYDPGYSTFRGGGEGWGGSSGGRYDRMMQGDYGRSWGGRDMGYGFEYDRGRGYGGTSEGNVGERGGWQRGGEQGGGRMRAAELMTENPECVTPDSTLADVARKMRDLNVGIIPVVDSMEGRRLQGVITDRDIAVRAVAEGKTGETRVSECMTSDVETVNKNDPVREVLSVMEREQVRRVPVTDREGRLVGIIAQADLVVDFGDEPRRERMVEHAIERISEPARPRRAEGSAQSGYGVQGRGAGGVQGTSTGRFTGTGEEGGAA